MNTLDRYLAWVIIVVTALVLTVLVALDRLFAFIGQLDEIGKGAYDVGQLSINVLLNTPQSIYEVMATASLLGALLGLGALADHSELVVIRSSGASIARLARPLAIVGILFAAIVFFLGDWVAPQASERATKLKLRALSKSISIGGASGLWLREGENYINVRKVLPGLNLKGVKIYRYAGRELRERWLAESANYTQEHGWTLTNVEMYRLQDGNLTMQKKPSLRQVAIFNPDMLRGLSMEPDMLSTSELYENIQYLQRNRLHTNTFEYAFWSKFSVPLSCIVMLLIALPFVLGLRRMSGGGQRIFIGSMLGIIYLLLSNLSSHIGIILGAHGAVGAFFPALTFAAIAVLWMWRIGRVGALSITLQASGSLGNSTRGRARYAAADQAASRESRDQTALSSTGKPKTE